MPLGATWLDSAFWIPHFVAATSTWTYGAVTAEDLGDRRSLTVIMGPTGCPQQRMGWPHVCLVLPAGGGCKGNSGNRDPRGRLFLGCKQAMGDSARLDQDLHVVAKGTYFRVVNSGCADSTMVSRLHLFIYYYE